MSETSTANHTNAANQGGRQELGGKQESSTQVDFYILQDEQLASRFRFVCRLCEKLRKLGHRISVILDSEAQARQLDQWLWEFPPESFLPHALNSPDDSLGQPLQSGTVITLGQDTDTNTGPDVCINLHSQPFAANTPVARLVEVVVQEPQVLEQTRQHFKFYRDRGYPIQSHPINLS